MTSSHNSLHPKIFLLTYATGSFSACTAETATFPADLTKTRMQIQGEVYSDSYKIPRRGMIQTVVNVVKEEGFFKLWHGLGPALTRHVLYSGARISMYTELREGLGVEQDGTFAFWKSAICGSSAGAAAQFFVSPLDLIKVQMQMDGIRVLQGKPPRLKGVFHGLRHTYKIGGFPALYKGWLPNVQRAAVVNFSDISTYDTTKHYLINQCGLKNGFLVQCIAGLSAGFIASLFGAPADVLKARVMNQPVNSKGQGVFYRGTIDCLRKSVRNEGIMVLYKGFFPLWARLGPWTLIFWVTLEWTRNFTGSEGF